MKHGLFMHGRSEECPSKLSHPLLLIHIFLAFNILTFLSLVKMHQRQTAQSVVIELVSNQ